MESPKKVLKKRVYTFGQLDTLIHRYRLAHPDSRLYGAPLIGRVTVTSAYNKNYMEILYSGKRCTFLIARVYRASDGDSVYVVYGAGQKAALKFRDFPKSKQEQVEQWWRTAWAKYAPIFTPLAPGATVSVTAIGYRLHDGAAASCGLPLGIAKDPHSDPQGVWMTRPKSFSMTNHTWAAKIDAVRYPNYARRCQLFAKKLRHALEDGTSCVMQFLWDHDCKRLGAWWDHSGACLQVCTPPTAAKDGHRLIVKISMHDSESRKHFEVDSDYAVQHCQFFALEDGKPRTEMMRWRCAKEAIAGIREWVIGDIYIPGPW